jgi:hypothetical protein
MRLVSTLPIEVSEGLYGSVFVFSDLLGLLYHPDPKPEVDLQLCDVFVDDPRVGDDCGVFLTGERLLPSLSRWSVERKMSLSPRSVVALVRTCALAGTRTAD